MEVDKRTNMKEEDLPSLPPISGKDLKSIIDVLSSIKNPNDKKKKLLTNSEINSLANLRFQDGEQILSLQYRWFVYEIIWILSKKGFDITYNFLNMNWEKILGNANIRKKILFENPLMEKSREKFLVDMEIYRNKNEVVEGGEACKKCLSTSTISVEKQMRSADEPVTIRVTCLECGYKWTAQ
jgi:DNA-directed RNA polymerase subunit M/transcription elongation factor TFIIS